MRNSGYVTVVLFLMISMLSFSQVGINNPAPDATAALDVTSTTKGFLPPRMDETARNNITLPAAGLIIYNTDTNLINYYNGTTWQALQSNGSYVDLTTNQTIAGNKTFNGTITPVGRMWMPMGEIDYFNTTGTTITITSTTSNGIANMFPVTVPATLAGSYEFATAGDGSLQYTGATTKVFHIAITISGVPQVASNVFIFGVGLDTGSGYTVQTTGRVMGSATGTQFSSLHIMLELATDDKIKLYIGNNSQIKDFTVNTLKAHS